MQNRKAHRGSSLSDMWWAPHLVAHATARIYVLELPQHYGNTTISQDLWNSTQIHLFPS